MSVGNFPFPLPDALNERATALSRAMHRNIYQDTDRLFARLMAWQWVGLATRYGIISQGDGTIQVQCERNQDAALKIHPPTLSAHSSDTGKKVMAAKGNESILVVEDDDAVRSLTVRVLRKCGYQVQEAGSAIEALKIVESQPSFDLILTDVIMPKMSGKELYDRLRIILPGVKVLFMSGYTDDALAIHGVLDPELKLIEKPFSPAELNRKIRELIDAPGK